MQISETALGANELWGEIAMAFITLIEEVKWVLLTDCNAKVGCEDVIRR